MDPASKVEIRIIKINILSFFLSFNMRTKSKRFAFVPIISGPNQNFLFRSISFGLYRNVLFCPRQFPDQIKLLCFVPKFLGQNGNDLLVIRTFWTKSKCFAFVPIISIPNLKFLLLSISFWIK
jgi:hypothetical protein